MRCCIPVLLCALLLLTLSPGVAEARKSCRRKCNAPPAPAALNPGKSICVANCKAQRALRG